MACGMTALVLADRRHLETAVGPCDSGSLESQGPFILRSVDNKKQNEPKEGTYRANWSKTC